MCALDILLIIAVSVITGSIYVRFHEGDADVVRYVSTAILASAVFVLLFRRRRLYDPSALANWSLQARSIATLWVMTILVLAGAVFALKIGRDFSRGAVLSFATVSPAVLFMHHVLWRAVITAGLRRGMFRGRNSILLWIRETPEAARIAQDHACDLEDHGFRISRVFHLGAGVSPGELIDRVVAFVRGSEVEEIFVAADLGRWREISGLIKRLCELPLPLTILPDESTAPLFARISRQFGNCVGVEIQRAPLTVYERFAKRLLDIVVSVGAIIALIPLFLIIAIAIKRGSPGDALFRQTRCGFNSRRFRIFKFRTMTEPEDGATINQAVRGDKRVTQIGIWLRRTSIDELPQLFNVVSGEMSLVGPRPHAAAHDSYFAEQIGHYVQRHHMKPGITGWAQIHGYRGETPTVQAMKERVDLDVWYAENWSIALDIQIIALTVAEVVRGRNAY